MIRRFLTASPRPAALPMLAVALSLSLGACQMTQQGTAEAAPPATDAAAQPSGPSQRTIERDVEAPEVFQVQEPGLWDGRPSLGGVWVAHPTAHDPERVMIRNTRTGATVIGALFRRERENPGPRFQISSEAANALGILAGAPTEIQVTALRLQRVEMEIDPAPAPATAADETLALTEAEAPAAGTTPTPDGAPQGQVAVTDDTPQRHGLLDFFRRRPRPAETAAIAESTLAPAAGAATAAVAAPTPAPAAPAAAAGAAPEVVEAPRQRRSLRDFFRRRAPEPDTTLIPVPDATGTPTAATQPLQASGSQPVPQQTTPAAPRIDRPFVQIGIFSVEQNAINARAQMQRAGLGAEIRRGRAGENLFWRVVVGPAASTAERAQFLQRVRALGFADAYAVQR